MYFEEMSAKPAFALKGATALHACMDVLLLSVMPSGLMLLIAKELRLDLLENCRKPLVEAFNSMSTTTL
jgi:hypothetical protein